MEIRKAELTDLERMLEIYEYARKMMRASGNPHQWGDSRPSRETVVSDIKNGTERGLFHRCMDFCESLADNIRIDTHKDNHIMRHLLEERGYDERGVIYVDDGSPRIAYQR